MWAAPVSQWIISSRKGRLLSLFLTAMISVTSTEQGMASIGQISEWMETGRESQVVFINARYVRLPDDPVSRAAADLIDVTNQAL